MRLVQGARKSSRAHHADGPQAAGGGYGTCELAARDAAGHTGLDHRALDPKLVHEACGTRWSHRADATCWMTRLTTMGRSRAACNDVQRSDHCQSQFLGITAFASEVAYGSKVCEHMFV